MSKYTKDWQKKQEELKKGKKEKALKKREESQKKYQEKLKEEKKEKRKQEQKEREAEQKRLQAEVKIAVNEYKNKINEEIKTILPDNQRLSDVEKKQAGVQVASLRQTDDILKKADAQMAKDLNRLRTAKQRAENLDFFASRGEVRVVDIENQFDKKVNSNDKSKNRAVTYATSTYNSYTGKFNPSEYYYVKLDDLEETVELWYDFLTNFGGEGVNGEDGASRQSIAKENGFVDENGKPLSMKQIAALPVDQVKAYLRKRFSGEVKGSLINNATGKRTINFKNIKTITPQQMARDLTKSKTFVYNAEHDPYIIGGMAGMTQKEIGNLDVHDIKKIDWAPKIAAKVKPTTQYMPGLTAEIMESIFADFNEAAHNAASDVESEGKLLVAIDKSAPDVVDVLNKLADQAVADFTKQYNFSPLDGSGRYLDEHKDWFRGYALKRADMIRSQLKGVLVNNLSGSLEESASPTAALDYNKNQFARFKESLSESRRQYLGRQGLGKRLEASFVGIKKGQGVTRVATSAEEELASLFSWANQKGFAILYEKVADGDTEKYKFFVTPQEMYNPDDIEGTKKNSYTFDFVAPDEFGRLTTGKLGSTSNFFYDFDTQKYLDLNTWGLAQNIETIKRYGNKEPGDSFYKTIDEVNMQLKAQRRSAMQAAPLDFYGMKDYESIKWDVSHSNVDVASEEEKARANALMSWTASLTKYLSKRPDLRKKWAQMTGGDENFESWDLPQTVLDLLRTYLTLRNYNPDTYLKDIEAGDNAALKEFIQSPEYESLRKAIDNYFGIDQGGYYINSLSHGGTATGKAYPTAEIDVPLTDFLVTQSMASENVSKGKANSVNRKIVSAQTLKKHGWKSSSLREKGTSQYSDLVATTMVLPQEVLQEAVRASFKGEFKEAVTEERLFGDATFNRLQKYYSNTKTNTVDTKEVTGSFRKFIAGLDGEIKDINDLALGQVAHFNQSLDKKTKKDLKLTNLLTIPKNSYIISAGLDEEGRLSVTYISETAISQAQKYIDTGTNKRYEAGFVRSESVVEAIENYDKFTDKEKQALIEQITSGDVHSYTMEAEQKRVESARTRGAYTYGFMEWLVNQIPDNETFESIANKYGAFGARYRWDKKKGVVSNLHRSGSKLITASGEDYYSTDRFWTQEDEKLRTILEKNIIKEAKDKAKAEEKEYIPPLPEELEKKIKELLPAARAAYAGTIDSLELDFGEEGKSISSTMFQDIANELGVPKELMGRIMYTKPEAGTQAEYSKLAGLGFIDNGESRRRMTQRIKESERDNLEKMVLGNRITQQQADDYMAEFEALYGAEERAINTYNHTLSAVKGKTSPIAGTTMFEAVIGDGQGRDINGAELDSFAIDISQASFENPKSHILTDDEYKKGVIGFLYNAVRDQGYALGENAQVRLSFRGLNDDAKNALKAAGFYDGQILAFTPEEISKINQQGEVTHSLGTNDRLTLQYLRGAQAVATGKELDKGFVKKATNKTGKIKANAYYQTELKKKIRSGGDIAKAAQGNNALLSGNFKIVGLDDSILADEFKEQAIGVISKQGAKNLYKIGKGAKEGDITLAFESIMQDIKDRNLEQYFAPGEVTGIENYYKAVEGKKWKGDIYTSLVDQYVDVLQKNHLALGGMLFRDPILSDANISKGVLINSDDSSQADNVLMLSGVLAELLKGDYDGDIVGFVVDLMRKNRSVGIEMANFVKENQIKTKAALEVATEKDKKSTVLEHYREALKQSEAIVNPSVNAMFTLGTHMGQNELGLASFTNTQTQMNLRANRAIYKDPNNSNYIGDMIFRIFAGEAVEQQGISAKKTLESILDTSQGSWSPEELKKLEEAVFRYNGSKEHNELLEKYKVKSDNSKIQYGLNSLETVLGKEALEASGYVKKFNPEVGYWELSDDFIYKQLARVARVNAEANGEIGETAKQKKINRQKYINEKNAIYKQVNPKLVGMPQQKTGDFFEDAYNFQKENSQLDQSAGIYDEHSKAVDLAAEAEKAKLGISAELAKQLGVEAKTVDNLTDSVNELTTAEQKNAEESEKQARNSKNYGEFSSVKDARDVKPVSTGHGYTFTLDGKHYGPESADTVTGIIGVRAIKENDPVPGSKEDVALQKKSAEGTYAHKLTELAGRYGIAKFETDANGKITNIDKDFIAELRGEASNYPELEEELKKADTELKNVFGTEFTTELKESLYNQINSAIRAGIFEGLFGENTRYENENTFAGKFANLNKGISGQADIINDDTYTVGDWKYSTQFDEKINQKRLFQANAYLALYESQMEMELAELQEELQKTTDPTQQQNIKDNIDSLTTKIEGYKKNGKVKVLVTSVDKNGKAFTRVLEADREDKEKVLEALNKNQEYKDLTDEYVKLSQAMKNGASGEHITKRLAEIEVRQQEILREGIGLDLSQSLANSKVTVYDSSGKAMSEEEKQNAEKNSTTNSEVNKYLKNYKEQKKVERDLQKKSLSLMNKEGIEAVNIQNEIDALKAKQRLLMDMQPVLEQGVNDQGEVVTMLNNQVLSEEQILKLTQQVQLIDAEHLVKQRAITSQAKVQQGILQKIIGGFKSQITMFIDTSLAYQAIGFVRSSIRELIQLTENLDAQIVNIQIATGYSRGKVHDMLVDYNKMASELGRTTSEVASAADEWLRAGYQGKEAAELVQASMMLSTLGQIEASEATSYLVSTLKGWKLEAEDVVNVVDKLTAVDMAAATSAGDLALAMSRANNSARVAGVDMNNFIGYVTTVSDITQKSAESVGESFKTIFSRFGNVKASKYEPTEIEEASEDYNSDEYENLNDIETVLSKVNIKIRENASTWRDVDDVISEIGEKWDNWDQTTQNAVATAIAGTRQRENVITLFENWDSVNKFAKIAEDAYGTATEKMAAYTDSVEASKQRFTNAVESWALEFRQEDTIKKFWNALSFVTENLNVFSYALIAFTVINNFQQVVDLLVSGITKLGTKIIEFNTFFNPEKVNPQGLGMTVDRSIEATKFNLQMRQDEKYNRSLGRYTRDEEYLSAIQLQSGIFNLLDDTETEGEGLITLFENLGGSVSDVNTKLIKTGEGAENFLVSSTGTKFLQGLVDESNDDKFKKYISGYLSGDITLGAGTTKGDLLNAVIEELDRKGLNGVVGNQIGANMRDRGRNKIDREDIYRLLLAGAGGAIGSGSGAFFGKTLAEEMGLEGAGQSIGLILGGVIGDVAGSKAGEGIFQGISKQKEAKKAGKGLKDSIVEGIMGVGAAGWAGIAITAATGFYNVYKKYKEEAQQEAQEAFKEAEENLTNAEGSVDLAKRYDELSAGVDKYGKNISLTDEEYQEFLETGNSLAELFPSLNRYTDENGNKILQLGEDYNSLTEEVESSYEALKKTANLALLDSNVMGPALSDAKKQMNALTASNGALTYSKTYSQRPYRTSSTGMEGVLPAIGGEEYDPAQVDEGEIKNQIQEINNSIAPYATAYLETIPGALKWEKKDADGEVIIDEEGNITYNDMTDDEESFVRSVVAKLDISEIGTEELGTEVTNLANKAKEVLEDSEITELMTKVDESENQKVGAYVDARRELAEKLEEQFGADGYDKTERKILLTLGFEVDDESGEEALVDAKNWVERIKDIKDKEGKTIAEGNGNEITLSIKNLEALDTEDAKKVYEWLKGGKISANESMDNIVNMLYADRNIPTDLTSAMDYLIDKEYNMGRLSETLYGVKNDDFETAKNTVDKWDTSADFSNYSENIRDQIEELKEKVLDEDLTEEEFKDKIDDILGAGYAELQEKGSKIAAAWIEEVFPSDIGVEGQIDSFNELKTTLEELAAEYELLSDAEEEYQKRGSLSLSTVLDLVTTNEEMVNVLEFEKDAETGQIKSVGLAANAKEKMALIQAKAVALNVAETITTKEQEIATLDNSIAETKAALQKARDERNSATTSSETTEVIMHNMDLQTKKAASLAGAISFISTALKKLGNGEEISLEGLANASIMAQNKVAATTGDWKVKYTNASAQELEQQLADLEEQKAEAQKEVDTWKAMKDWLLGLTEENIGSELLDEGFIESTSSAKEAIDKLKDAIAALNLEYEQMIAYSEKGVRGVEETANALTKQYYEVKRGLLDTQINLLKKNLNGRTLKDIMAIGDEETFDKVMEYYTDLQDAYIERANLDDEELDNRLEMLTVMGEITQEQIDLYKAKLETADTQQEELEYLKEYNEALIEQIELQKEINEYQKKRLEFRLEYLEGIPEENSYKAAMKASENSLTEAIEVSRKLIETTYQQMYEYYMKLGLYTSSEAAELAKESEDYRNAVEDYLEAQQALGDLYMEDFNNKIDAIERRMDELQTSKPNDWASSWNSANTKVVDTAISKIKDYYGEMDAFYTQIAEIALETLNKYAGKLTDEQVEELTDQYNDAMKNIRDNAVSLHEDIKEYQESVYSALTAEVERYKEQLEEQKELVEDYYDTELDKLNDKNEAIERTNKLLELQQNLLNAQDEKKRVFRQGIGWVYESDREKIRDAQKDLDDFYLEDSINDLTNAKEAELEALEERIANWNDYLEMLQTKYEEYDRLQQQKLLMELLGVSSQEEVEQIIRADMLDFTEYMDTHLTDFFNNQIDAFSNFNTVFGEFLQDYKENLEELNIINTSPVETITADGYLKLNDRYLNIPDDENVEDNLYKIVLNDKKIAELGAITSPVDPSGFVDYSQAARNAYASGDVAQTVYDLVLREAKMRNNDNYAKYKGTTEALVEELKKSGLVNTNSTTGALSDIQQAFTNGQTMANKLAEKNLAITTDASQFTIALASNLPSQLSEEQAESLIQMVESTEAFTGAVDTVGLSVNGTFTKGATSITDALSQEASSIVNYLMSIDKSLTKEEATTAVESALNSYSTLNNTGSSSPISYDFNTDYTAAIAQAKAIGDETAVRILEAQRAQKLYDTKNKTGQYLTASASAKKSAEYGLATSSSSSKSSSSSSSSTSSSSSSSGKISYNFKTDYQAEINKAKAKGDTAAVATLTAQRNAKIADTKNKTGQYLTASSSDKKAAEYGASKSYSTGIENGPVTYTGLAMLHGTPDAPEYVLNNDQAYNLLKNMSLKKPEFSSNLESNSGDNWTLNGDIILENCDDPAQFWNEVTKAMSNRYNVSSQKYKK